MVNGITIQIKQQQQRQDLNGFCVEILDPITRTRHLNYTNCDMRLSALIFAAEFQGNISPKLKTFSWNWGVFSPS